MFPKNTWYVACTPDEIEEKPLGRTICGEPMVFFRGREGKVAALDITDIAIAGEEAVELTYRGQTIEVLGVTAADLSVDDFDFL